MVHATLTATVVATADSSRAEREQDLEKLKRRRCSVPMSKLMIFSFIVMITGFTFATPFSLLLTIPAYMLANQVSSVHCVQKGLQ